MGSLFVFLCALKQGAGALLARESSTERWGEKSGRKPGRLGRGCGQENSSGMGRNLKYIEKIQRSFKGWQRGV